MSARSKSNSRPRRLLLRILLAPFFILGAYFLIAALCLILLNFVNPPTTGVQIQRRVEAILEGRSYRKLYQPVDEAAISVHLRHAVIAAEDGRFYVHSGIDWQALRQAVEENRRRGRPRGGSTITQQLVKNLFMTTHSSYVRKVLEVPTSYLAEALLSKERMLTVYLNVVELGDGVFGAEAAARHYFGKSASKLSRREAAGLAAVLPSPRSRTPQSMSGYTSTILTRMSQMGW